VSGHHSDEHSGEPGHDHGPEHGPEPEQETVGDYVRGFFSNWSESDASLGRKVWLTLKNRSRAYAPPFRGCCGHPGEPGC